MLPCHILHCDLVPKHLHVAASGKFPYHLHNRSLLLQHKLKVSRIEGSEAQRRATDASSSYEVTSEQLSKTRESAAEAASTAAAEISDLQVGSSDVASA